MTNAWDTPKPLQEEAETFLHLTVKRREKSAWVKAARVLFHRGQIPSASISDFVTDTLNERAKRVNGE